MADLKRYYDRCVVAEAEVQRIAAEVDTLLEAGGEENEARAMELRPALDGALERADEAQELYASMQRSNRPNDAAKNFVPVSNTSLEGEDEQPSTIKRSEFELLDDGARDKFIRSGGRVED